jgi:hypothetical protein
MAAPSVYLDECVDHRLVEALRRQGFDVLTVQDAGTRSDDDEAQLLYATSQGRVFFSHNQLHFRRLHAAFIREGRAHGGIILIPQTVPFSRLELRAALMMEWVGTMSDHESRLLTWSELQQRLIHGYRLPDWSEQDVREALARR